MENAGSPPPRCPCGFWGSPQTLNLCSKCFKDELQRKEKVEENNASVPSTIPKLQTSGRNESKQDLGKVISREQLVNREVQGDTNDSKCRKTETEQAAQGNNSLDLETSEQEKGSRNEVLGKDISTQKKRKRCWACKAKLELAQRELGNCRCDFVFCQLHRLPEQHNCVFDHKESGRQEARKKMVSPGPKKVGRSFQRIDE